MAVWPVSSRSPKPRQCVDRARRKKGEHRAESESTYIHKSSATASDDRRSRDSGYGLNSKLTKSKTLATTLFSHTDIGQRTSTKIQYVREYTQKKL